MEALLYEHLAMLYESKHYHNPENCLQSVRFLRDMPIIGTPRAYLCRVNIIL